MLKRIRELLTRRSRSIPPEEGHPGEPDSISGPGGDIHPAGSVQSSSSVHVHHGPQVIPHSIPPSTLDADAVRIIDRLTRFDHTAYLVGGCVRDLLLDRRPKDFDIATSATPRQVKRLFSNCRIIGRRFRLAHVYFQNGKIIEVATFRARDGDDDEVEKDEAHDLLIRDDNVFGTPEEDVLRRDFTINALFYDVKARTVIDHSDGMGDLRRKLVRTIGDPVIRFREDPIRILRAVKFAARLAFAIEAQTLDALRRTRHEIPRAAAPRILEEINRFCRGGAARRSFELLQETGVFEVILPAVAARYAGDEEARNLLALLLDALDQRRGNGREASTGEILAILLLPLLAERIGWRKDSVSVPARGIDVRAAADELLRTMAQQLRMSRRDQETSRQILQTIARMVPGTNLRRGHRQAILRRPAFPACMWILEAVAASRAGAYAEALGRWSAGVVRPAPDREPARIAEHVGAAAPRQPGAPPDQGGQRRRRRRSRRRGKGIPGGAREAVASADAAKTGSNLPPPWDDSYFFAALPSVPELGEETKTERPGAEDLDEPSVAPEAGSQEEVAVDADALARRRPRRRRRRRSRRGHGRPGGESQSPEPERPA